MSLEKVLCPTTRHSDKNYFTSKARRENDDVEHVYCAKIKFV